MDVVARQQRPRLARRDQLRQPVEDDEVGTQIVDDEAVPEEIERPPVHVDLGRFGEQPVGIVEPHVLQLGLAPDRAVDPADADAQARGGRHRRDPVDDQPVAGLGVEEGEQRRDDDQQGDQDDR